MSMTDPQGLLPRAPAARLSVMPVPLPPGGAPRRRRWLPGIRGGALAAALALVVTATGLGALAISLHGQGARIEGLGNQLGAAQRSLTDRQRALDELTRRLAGVEATLRDQPNPVEAAAKVAPSVFTVQAGQFSGTAFVESVTGGQSLLITNFHVIQSVWDSGGRTVSLVQKHQVYRATIERVSRVRDLALLEAARTLPTLELNRTLPSVGSTVIVVGSPEGLEGTVASGIVSAIRQDYIQFSAPVSPGNSGSPLLNSNGQVLGVITSKVVQRGAEGLSFAIPAAVLCQTIVAC